MCKYYKTLFTPHLEVKPENAIGTAYVKKNKTKKQWQINWSYHWKMIVYSFLQTCSCCDFNPFLHGSPLTFKVVSHPYLNISTYLQSSSPLPF